MGIASDSTFCGGDPVNHRDPTGNARKTKNGGVNPLGNRGDEIEVTDDLSQALFVATETAGNTLSTALMLDWWADANVVMGDSSRSGKEQLVAGAKGAGIVVANLLGGQVLGTAGKALLRIPGAQNLATATAAKLASTKVGQTLLTDVNCETDKEQD